jgi:lipoprotein-anchoring transpeptidase ErfK/SrfK
MKKKLLITSLLLLILNVFSFDVSIKENSYYPNKKIKEYIMTTSIEKIDEVKMFLIDNALRTELKVEKNFPGNYFFVVPLKNLVGNINLMVKIKYDNKEFSKFYPNFLNADNYKTETDIKIIPLKSEKGLDFLIDVSYSKNIQLKQIKINDRYFNYISDLKEYIKELENGSYSLDFQFEDNTNSKFSRKVEILKIDDFVISNNAVKPQENIMEIKYYVVKKGDSIYKIADKYGVTPGDILNLNDLKEPSKIYVGQVLKIGKIVYGQSILRLEIDISNNFLYLYYDDLLIKKYLVAVGRSDSTPPGYYRIYYKEKEPPLYWGDEIIYSGSIINGIGSRWLQLSQPQYGIHGTTKPWEIGKMISHGCIRMFNFNVEELDFIASLGTEVYVFRDEQEKAMLKNGVNKNE